MRVVFDLPDGTAIDTSRRETIAPLGAASLRWGPLVRLPDDRTRWIQSVLREGVTASGRLELVDDTLDRTKTGWPVRLVLTRHGEQWRLHAFYAFLEHAAVARVEAPHRESVEAHRGLLRTGAPRFELGVVALSDLWDIPEGASPPLPDDLEAASIVDTAGSRHLEGVALASAGHTREAIAAWEAAAALDPLHTDSLYNAGIAHHQLGDLVSALACWQRGLQRTPRDFWFLRKIIQALTALGRFAEAGDARNRLLDVWSSSADPAVQRARSYVFVQSTNDGHTVHGSEVLGAGDGHPQLFFEPAHTHGHRLRVHITPLAGGSVQVDLEHGDDRRELAILPARPPLPSLLAQVHAWLAAAASEPSRR